MTHCLKVQDPGRIETRKKHRNFAYYQQTGQFTETLTFKTDVTSQPPKSIANMKPIFLSEMFSKSEGVFKDRILSGILIEPGAKANAVHSIMEDAKGQFIVISFYNLAGKQLRKISVGQRIDVMNPYIRTAADGQLCIRVDNPKTVFFGDREEICYYCTKTKAEAEKLSRCAKCNKTQYCSKECQADDWKVLEHKKYCK
jgi:hypothetical protein